MDFTVALGIVTQVIQVLDQYGPEVVAAIPDLKKFGVDLVEELTGTPISDADLATLEATIDDLHNQLQ